MVSISDPIHKAKPRVGEEPVARVILNDQGNPRNALCFFQKYHWIGRMMQYVAKHNDIEGAVTERKARAVKFLDRNPGLWPDQDINAGHREVWATFQHPSVDGSIAAANIEHRMSSRRYGVANRVRQNGYAPCKNEALMKRAYCADTRPTIVSAAGHSSGHADLPLPTLPLRAGTAVSK